MTVAELAEILHRENCSCVIFNHGVIRQCHRRGVADLYQLLTREPALLKGALIADKVIGKGAAALMAQGGVSGVYADVASTPALELLRRAGIPVECITETPRIVNRAATGPCPVETLCAPCATPAECVPLIASFLNHLNENPS